MQGVRPAQPPPAAPPVAVVSAGPLPDALAAALRGLALQPVPIAGSAEVRRALATRPPLALVDLAHPEALAVVSALRAEPTTAATVVVVYGAADAAARALACGADEGLAPTDDATVATARLGRLLRQRQTAARVSELEATAQWWAVSREVLRRLAASSVVATGLQGIFDAIVAEASTLLAGRLTLLHRWDPERDVLRLASAGGEPFAGLRREIRAEEGIAGMAFRESRAVSVADYGAWPGALGPLRGQPDIAAVAVPLRVGEQSVGALTVIAQRATAFPDEAIALLEAFASWAAAAVVRAEAQQAVERRAGELEAVAHVARTAARTLDRAAVLQTIVEEARRALGGDLANVLLREGEADVWRNAAIVGARTEHWHGFVSRGPRSLSTWMAHHRQPIVIADYPRERGTPTRSRTLAAREGLISAVGAPLIVGDRVIGALYVASRQRGRFGPADAQFLHVIADQAAIALHNAQLFSDLAERARALAASEARFRLLTEVSTDVIFALDPDGGTTFVNPRVHDVLGYEPGALFGRRFVDLVEPDARRTLSRLLRRLVRRPRAAGPSEVTALAADGTPRRLEVSAVPLVVDGQVVALHGIARDVTERAARVPAEAHADRLRALGQMAAGVAHDFNNLLAVVLARADLLVQRDDLPSSVRDEIGVIARAAEDAAVTVRRLHSFARREAPAEQATVNLDSLAREAVDLTRPSWHDVPAREGRSIAVEVDLASGLAIAGSAAELRELLTNLILNACDAMPQGGTLRLRAWAEGRWVRVAVHDTGMGMSREVQQHIFEPFFTTKAPQGSGLGLAVSQAIAQRHGGSLTVQSAPGRGTTATLRLPAAPPQRVPAAEGEPPPLPPQRILVVDDAPQVRQTLVRLLEEDGHRVRSVASGAAALAALGQEPLDLLITDLGMPGMSGYEVAEAVRQRWPGLPVVVATGWREQVDAARVAAAGVSAVLHKPFRQRDLRRALAEVRALPPPAAQTAGLVLVVDDEADLTQLMARLLSSAGYEVVEAQRGAAALAALEHAAAAGRPFDVLLTDLVLPEMDGWTLAREVRRRESAIAIGVVSAMPSVTDAELAAQGVDFAVAKPYRLDEVLSAMVRAVALRRTRQQPSD
ncbi:MAG: response regulator [Chloroflexi bacterium]|nr:response regulator [Chloroflexota bacterium]